MESKFDLIIVGGGAAGMMAGVLTKDKGLNFLIIESNDILGKKLAITGKGRCNLSNYNTDIKSLVNQYHGNNKFLFSAFSQFSVEDTVRYFEENLGIKIKIERGDRVFPKSDESQEIIDSFTDKLKDHVMFSTKVSGFNVKDGKIESVKTTKGDFVAKNYLICTGGKTYPLTGSTGDGYEWTKSFGHSITKLKQALVGVVIEGNTVCKLAGLSLKNVNISVIQNKSKIYSQFGEALFTHVGMSGPVIIDLSRGIGNLLEDGEIELVIDFKPAMDEAKLSKRINRDLTEAGNKAIKNSLGKLLPRKLIPVIINVCEIDLETKASQLSKEKRKLLVRKLKHFSLKVEKVEGWENAVITSGGVNTKEIDPKTMKSKLVDNLYFAGEIIDVYGPTGGYNLQLCWSTAYAAVMNMLNHE